MKKRTIILFISIIVIALLTNACSIQKKKYSKGFYITKQQGVASHSAEIIKSKKVFSPFEESKSLSASLEAQEISVVLPNALSIEGQIVAISEQVDNVTEPDTLCDLIIFKDSREVSCKLIAINPDNLKYYKCGMEDGPIVTVRKDKVLTIKYKNGEVEHFSQETKIKVDEPADSTSPPKVVERFGVLSLFLGLLALLAPMQYLAIGGVMIFVAIIFGFVSLSRIKKDPEAYKGKVFTYLGLVLGFISLLLVFSLIV